MNRIVQKIRIPIEFAEIDVDTSKEEISKLINSIIVDKDFRTQFNKNPEKILKEAGISLDQVMIEKLKRSTITETLQFTTPKPEFGPAGAVIAGAIAIVGAIGPAEDTG